MNIKIKTWTLNDLPSWTRGQGCINNLATARWGGKQVEFTYKTGDTLGIKTTPLEVRKMDVMFVHTYKGCDYVRGYCHTNKEVRSYGLRKETMFIDKGETCALREVVAKPVEAQQPVLF
jgi:predicted DNA-binding transcriptional regulator YafY